MLNQPPTQDHLARMYFELSRKGARAVGKEKNWPYQIHSPEHLVALAGDMSRYDPRLFDVLVELFYFHWEKFNPVELRQNIKKMTTPQVFGVMGEFLKDDANDELHFYFDYLLKGVSPVSTRLFFFNLYQPGSLGMQRASLEPLQEYLAWGFLARERPVIHDGQRKILGHWGPQARQNIIDRLISKTNTLSVSDYLESLDHTISRQQALLDLKESPRLKPEGKGRGSYWKAG